MTAHIVEATLERNGTRIEIEKRTSLDSARWVIRRDRSPYCDGDYELFSRNLEWVPLMEAACRPRFTDAFFWQVDELPQGVRDAFDKLWYAEKYGK